MSVREKIKEIISKSKVSELAWKYCDLNDEENGDYNKELADSITAELIKELEGLKTKEADGLLETMGALMMSSFGMEEGFNEYKELKAIEAERKRMNKLIDAWIKEIGGGK